MTDGEPGSTRPSEKAPAVLVIAGFDPSGGAGLLRDVATLEGLGTRARAVVAALTAQDETRFDGFVAVDPAFLQLQIDAVTRAPFAAVKIGMLGSTANAGVVATYLRGCGRARTGDLPVVVDPVLRASAGGWLTDDATLDALRSWLLPLATVITPNIPEAEVLTGARIRSVDDMRAAAVQLRTSGCRAVVIKGGHGEGDRVSDVLVDEQAVHVIERDRLPGGIHGSGCRFSSALAAHLALGRSIEQAVRRAGDFVAEAIACAG